MSLHYRILLHPERNVFEVTLCFKALSEEIGLSLPSWVPGSYMVRDMAGDIIELRARAGKRDLAVQKLEKSLWQITGIRKNSIVEVSYEVFATDISVRRAYLDTRRGLITFSSLCLLPQGADEDICEVEFAEQNTVDWSLFTTLAPVDVKENGFGLYRADNFQALIDTPVEMGKPDVISFTVLGTPHRMIISGDRFAFDIKRLQKDLKKALATVIAFWEPEKKKAPFKSYDFYLNVGEAIYGGLEHASSTALAASYYDLPRKGEDVLSNGYRRLLELMVHEYFHAWWVKRVKPAVFIPYDLRAEGYTQLLWVFEGFTSYYAPLLLARSGVFSADNLLESLNQALGTFHNRACDRKQTLAESSFDAWIKYYKIRANRNNAVTSYYDKGAIAAMALDARIREKSRGKKSLDDVLRLAWAECKKAGQNYRGIGENDMPSLFERATALDLTDEIDAWINKTGTPDLTPVAKTLGLEVKTESLPICRRVLGLSVKGEVTLVVREVEEAGAGQNAGLMVDDELVALNGYRVNERNFEKVLAMLENEKTLTVHYFRQARLHETAVKKMANKEKSLFKAKKQTKALSTWIGQGY